MNTRRAFLAGTAGLSAAALAACATGTTNQVVTIAQQVVDDAGLIANGIAAEVGPLQTLGVTLTPDTLTKINAGVTAAKNLVAGMAANVALPLVQQIVADVNAVVAAVGAAGATVPSSVQNVIGAAEALLPLVELAVGLVVAPKVGRMSPAQARRVLAAAHR